MGSNCRICITYQKGIIEENLNRDYIELALHIQTVVLRGVGYIREFDPLQLLS